MAKYTVVTHTGPHQPGEVVEITPEHEANGVDIARLITLGAVREATDEEAAGEVVPIGTNYLVMPQLIPQVPPRPAAIKPTAGKRNGAAAQAEQISSGDKAGKG